MAATRTNPLLAPHYMRRFACTGSECEDTCCQGWRVDIDRKTVERYQTADLPLWSARLKEHFVPVAEPTETRAAVLKLNEHGFCPFLSAERLCGIHRDLGEDFLSLVCLNYPRVDNYVNGLVERSLALSCPEAARVALLQPEGISFDQGEVASPFRTMMKNVVDTAQEAAKGGVSQYFWELRFFAIQVLQTRSYSLAERLMLLGMFCRLAEKQADEGRLKEIPQTIARWTVMLEDGTLRPHLEGISVSLEFQTKLLAELLNERTGMGLNRGAYLDCLREFATGLGANSDRSVTEVAGTYREVYQKHMVPFMASHGYILENYLVNQVFQALFPYKGLTRSFTTLVVQYALVKLLLTGLAAYHEGLTPELAIRLIYSFNRSVLHVPEFVQRVTELLEESALDNLAAMALLIMN